MAIVTHRIEGEITESDQPQGDRSPQGNMDATQIVLDYTANAPGLPNMQGWELKRLSEACKEIIAVKPNAGVSAGLASAILQTIRDEWQRRRGLSAEEATAEAKARDEISERTGKPKKLPRGKPFKKGSDERRNASGNGGAQGEGEGENDADAQGESGEQGKGDSDAEGESEQDEGSGGQSPQNMPQLPPESTEQNDGAMESIMRRIAREEDFKVVQAVDANFTAISKELARVAKLAASGGNGAAKTIIVDKSTNKQVVIDGHAHEALEKCVRAVRAGFRNILLVGPAGSGKSTLGEQLSKVLADLMGHPDDWDIQPCSVGMTESVFFGRLLPVGDNGAFSYIEPAFVRIYENGGVFVVDEIDAADANVLVAVNGALENNKLSLPARIGRTRALRHPHTVIVACANTWGHGADRMYVGRNQLDAATLRRFSGARFSMDYDRALEKKLCADTALLTAVWAIRDRVKANNVRRVWGTGELIAAAKWRAAGLSVEAAIRTAMGDDWTPDDLAKVGLTVAKPKGAM